MTFDLHHGDCLATLRTMPDNSVDSVVTDPPYGLSFMGKKWDYDVPSVDIWNECLRVLKPGGHLLAFSGSRTYHRMTVAIEDAGFEIRDQIMWVYGSGFPKSLDVSKAIDKAAGVEFDAVPASGVGFMNADGAGGYNVTKNQLVRKGEGTEAAKQWQGFGTALKPAHEPICVARKPLEGTVAANVLKHGTGALNIDGCRVPASADDDGVSRARATGTVDTVGKFGFHKEGAEMHNPPGESGRFPANLIHDGSEEVVALFPVTSSGSRKAGDYGVAGSDEVFGKRGVKPMPEITGDCGSAARFFYCAKTSKADRNEGLDDFAHASAGEMVEREEGSAGMNSPRAGAGRTSGAKNNHPTVKPTDLMRYLCRLVTPPGGVVLDPFMGSGSTGKAAMLEGFRFIGCEMSEEYIAIANARIAHALFGDLA